MSESEIHEYMRVIYRMFWFQFEQDEVNWDYMDHVMRVNARMLGCEPRNQASTAGGYMRGIFRMFLARMGRDGVTVDEMREVMEWNAKLLDVQWND